MEICTHHMGTAVAQLTGRYIPPLYLDPHPLPLFHDEAGGDAMEGADGVRATGGLRGPRRLPRRRLWTCSSGAGRVVLRSRARSSTSTLPRWRRCGFGPLHPSLTHS
jgi:hypothetical protein